MFSKKNKCWIWLTNHKIQCVYIQYNTHIKYKIRWKNNKKMHNLEFQEKTCIQDVRVVLNTNSPKDQWCETLSCEFLSCFFFF